ncbi:MAG: DNA primase [Lachnospiraceae bacterium]|nr:DNA primase [Lachnospiraceae bacterium]
MRYSDDLIEEVRSANDIIDVVGAVVRLKRSGSNYVGLCPFHNEKTPSFSVSQSRQMYYCFGCHAGGNVFTFMMSYYQSTFQESMQMLADRAGIRLPEPDISKENKAAADRKAELFEINKQAAGYFHYLLKQENGRTGLEYLKNRGLSEETIRKFGLGYADKFNNDLYRYLKNKGWSDERLNESGLFLYNEKHGFSDKFWNRVMFPILDVRNRVIGFGGRVMGDGKPKYLNSPETELFNKRLHLFGLNIARSSRERFIILCEGYMDVISMHQAGFTNAVASLGTALTPQQASLLKRYTSDVKLLYDSDGAGVMAALRAIPILKAAGIKARVVSLAPYKDPDELIQKEGAEALTERLNKAENGFMFEIRQLSYEHDLNDPQGQTDFQRDIATRLLSFEEELERDNYRKAIAAEYHISEEGLQRLVNSLALKGTPAEHYRKPKETAPRPPAAEDKARMSQKLMLTYLARCPEAFELTRDYIGPEDFQDPLCRRIAEGLYAQYAAGDVREAALLNAFTDPEAQQEVAGFFNTEIHVSTDNDRDRAFTDTLLRIMKQSNEAALKAWDGKDLGGLTALMDKKKRIESLEKTGQVFHLKGGLE